MVFILVPLHFSVLETEDDETAEEAVPRLISRNRTYALLNAGAFGTAYDAVRELAAALRRYSEDESEIFYDQLCIPLVRRSLEMARKFFGTERCLFVPNCEFSRLIQKFRKRGENVPFCFGFELRPPGSEDSELSAKRK